MPTDQFVTLLTVFLFGVLAGVLAFSALTWSHTRQLNQHGKEQH